MQIVVHRIDVLALVQLDRKFRFTACKIDNVRSDNQLAREARPVMPQPKPQ